MALVKYNNNSISTISSAGQLASGSLVPISEQTASGSASISFTTGIDSTYPIYKFEFINIHPATNSTKFQFNLSTDGGSTYNVTKTTTTFQSYHYENNVEAILGYDTADDEAQTTGNAEISASGTGNGSDEHLTGEFSIFNPSSSVYVKHIISNVITSGNALSHQTFMAGYGNTSSPINSIKFQFASGNIDSGTIKLYGIKDS